MERHRSMRGRGESVAWRDRARGWCAGRDWQWRLPLLAYLAFTASRGLTDPKAWIWWSGLTLGVHEMGHILFSPFGEFLAAAGGSITQLAAPVAVAWMLKRQGDWFGVAVGGSWLGYSLANLATYIADARAQELPLVGMTDDPEHDWHYLLGRLGWLRHDARIAELTRAVSVVVLGASVVFGLWLCREMWRGRGGTAASSFQLSGSDQ